MLKINSFVVFFLYINCNIVWAQIGFEKGYFIDNDGQKTDCFIKNIAWNFNPSGINYKLTENADVLQTAEIGQIKNLAIYDKSKYVRADVDIDRSSDSFTNLNWEPKPIFEQERLFLKVLVESPTAILYGYESTGLERFFYSTATKTIKQLVYKKYRI